MADRPTTLRPGLPDGLAASHRAWVEAVDHTDLDDYAGLVCEDVVWLPPGEEVEHVGHFVILWRRDDDGTWRIERYADDS